MKQNNKRNKLLLFFTITLIIVCAYIFLQNKNGIARFVWKHLKNERISTMLEKNDTDLYTQIGYYYFGGGAYDLEKSRASFLKVLELDPNAPNIHYQLGRIYFINGDFTNSLRELYKELELHPENLSTYYVLGLVYGYRDQPGDLKRAEEGFTKFTKWATKNWAGYNDLAWIQVRLEKYKEAKVTVATAFEKIPWVIDVNPWLWTTLGIAELNLKNYTKSRDAFLRARSISEKIDAQYFLSAYPGNDSKNAEEIFNQYKATINFNLGIVYENLGDIASAKKEYESYLKILPQGPFPKEHEVIQKIKELGN